MRCPWCWHLDDLWRILRDAEICGTPVCNLGTGDVRSSTDELVLGGFVKFNQNYCSDELPSFDFSIPLPPCSSTLRSVSMTFHNPRSMNGHVLHMSDHPWWRSRHRHRHLHRDGLSLGDGVVVGPQVSTRFGKRSEKRSSECNANDTKSYQVHPSGRYSTCSATRLLTN